MADFNDAGRFVGQPGAASFGSGGVGKLSVAKTEEICKKERGKLIVKQCFTELKAKTDVIFRNIWRICLLQNILRRCS